MKYDLIGEWLPYPYSKPDYPCLCAVTDGGDVWLSRFDGAEFFTLGVTKFLVIAG